MELMLDIEAVGQNSWQNAVVNVSTVLFDRERFTANPYSFEELLKNTKVYKLDLADQVKNHGLKLDSDSLKWWETQAPEVRNQIKKTKYDLSVESFMQEFIGDLMDSPKIEYWWSRNNTFDPIALWNLSLKVNRKHDLNQYLLYWRVRDVITWVDAKMNFGSISGFIPVSDEEYWKKTFIQHVSSHDVCADVLRLQAITRAENDLDMVDR